MHRWPTLLVCVWLALVAGCSVESAEGGGAGRRPSAGAGGAAAEPVDPSTDEARATLTIVGASVVRLGFGESVELVVKLENSEGEPQRGQAIAFDLVGRPEDSLLSALVAETNSSGQASVTLQAASRPVTFEVRASNGRARPIAFSISVSGNGFGTLIVNAPYSGVRAVEERFVLALPEIDCALAEYAPGDPKTVLAPGEDRATLVALPAGLPYAVVAMAESASGEIVARGCLPVTTVIEQGEQQVTVPFFDLPLVPEDRVSLELTLEAGSAAAAISAEIRSSVSELIRTSGRSAPRDAEGHFWLDSLDTVLRDDGDEAMVELADVLAAARLGPEGGAPASELTDLLELNDEGVAIATSVVAARVRGALDTLALTAELAIEGGLVPIVTVDSLRFAALPVVAGDPPPRVALSTETASVDAELMSDSDLLTVNELEFSPRLGALASEALDHLLAADPEQLGVDLTATAGCSSLAEWLDEQTYVIDAEGICDLACVHRACALSWSRVAAAAGDALALVDEERPLATLNGSFVLTDGDGDLRAEKMEAERIDGSWAPAPDASLGDSFRGTATSVAAP